MKKCNLILKYLIWTPKYLVSNDKVMNNLQKYLGNFWTRGKIWEISGKFLEIPKISDFLIPDLSWIYRRFIVAKIYRGFIVDLSNEQIYRGFIERVDLSWSLDLS